MCKYVCHRLIRLSDTTHNIAAGLANGAVVSFTPFVGVHFVQALLFSYIIRANYLASVIGTFIGNPWTFPFMWLLAWKVGVYVMGWVGADDFIALPDEMSLGILWEIIKHHPFQLFLPWTIGSYICAIFFWPIYYGIAYYSINKAKIARKKYKLYKVHKTAQTITGQAE